MGPDESVVLAGSNVIIKLDADGNLLWVFQVIESLLRKRLRQAFVRNGRAGPTGSLKGFGR